MASRAAAGCFLVALGTGAAAVLIAAAPDAGRLVLWGVGWIVLTVAMGRRNKSVKGADNPTPPAQAPVEETPEREVRKVGDSGTIVYHRDQVRRYTFDRDRASDTGRE